jgi:DNA mismatch repair protein MutS2
MLYPAHFEQKIDFTAIRQLLKDKCISTLGAEKVDNIQFSADFQTIDRLLNETDEMFRVLTSGGEELPIGDFFDVRPALSRVRVEGLFLDELEVFGLWRALEAVRKLVSFLTKKEENPYPYLSELLPGTETFPLIIKRIDGLLTKFGKLKDNASPELARIRKDIHQVENSVSRDRKSVV